MTFEAFAITRALTTFAALFLQARHSGDVVVAADTVVDKLRYVPRAEAIIAIALGITPLTAAV